MNTTVNATEEGAAPAPAALLDAWLESLPEPHILFDRSYRIVAANGAYRQQYGQGGSVLGRTCHAVSHHSAVPCDQAGESCPLARSLVSGQRERVLHLHHTRSGREYVQIELTPLRAGAGEPLYFLERMEPLRIAQGAGTDAPAMLGRAPAFRAALELIARVAPSQASVLLLGESGTGKELAARAVHEASTRAARPLVAVDCASLPESLFESELFGHEKGAFTGAHAARAGLVEAAHGGTLFLDEVGDIPLTMQVKLLRLLESGTYRRVGQSELRRADIRLVAATHRDLGAMVRAGQFRQDLYYRLSTFPITLPALRERAPDIPLLAESLLQRVAPGRRLTLAPAALRCLAQHPFPGNVRELRNVLERAALLTDGDTITAATVARALTFDQGGLQPAATGQTPAPAPAAPDLRSLQDAALRSALQTPGRTRRELAAALGISPRTLYRKLRSMQKQ
ncbi:sigma-54-dependent Fis family transcriptional regulator [Oryzisolibacter sp. LB2S]|uniref:sigma-54 interaction domain-containing protein n=1 Tax=Alicycliphilus soli TaxID=3228789 RepID=UPI00345B444B